MLEAHERNLENIGHEDLCQYVRMTFDDKCDHADGCGYDGLPKNYINLGDEEDELQTDIILPEPLESYTLGMKSKKLWLERKIKSLKEELLEYEKELETC